MGLFDGKKNEPQTRNPRPKGAQKGVGKRVHQAGPLNFGGKARTPWLFSGSGKDSYMGKDEKHRWF